MTRLPSNSGTGHLAWRFLLAACHLAPVIILQFYFYLPLISSTSFTAAPPCCSGGAECRCSANRENGCCCARKQAGKGVVSCSEPCGNDSDTDPSTPEKLEFLRSQTAYQFPPAAEPIPDEGSAAPLPSSFRPPPDPPPRPSLI